MPSAQLLRRREIHAHELRDKVPICCTLSGTPRAVNGAAVMKTFNHILVPTDFDPASLEALDWAVGMARAFNAKVTLLHVWEIPIYPYMDFMLNSELISRVEDAATSRLARTLQDVKKSMPNAESILRHGMPWSTILNVIEETGADLVVMGTHGRRGVSHVLLGSVAEKVVRLSPVAVLTVHASNGVSKAVPTSK